MKLKFLIFVVMSAAMGPAREAEPPAAESVTDRPMSPEELPETAASEEPPETPSPELRIVDASTVAMADFLWNMRPVVIFADSPDDPSFRQQSRALQARPNDLIERDVVVVVDTDPAAGSEWRRQLHPRGFSLVIIDKDGQVKARKPLPWDVREITRTIDKFPLRRQEIGR
ncbi:DUF4174 domain-containing protein [Paracoccus sp. 11-3]|uniref:DUF4174 domain-containing protein n=1 Tax=Paracoccus amoyensis TaxID=2760093 RepID=A0A926JB88_9RHOB|nr:DUF4174 domain-containing protein [Paracoccus amoyensis]MBC9245590.1 DUF4174 domain-containing protein [Paracoccus amoyensis]